MVRASHALTLLVICGALVCAASAASSAPVASAPKKGKVNVNAPPALDAPAVGEVKVKKHASASASAGSMPVVPAPPTDAPKNPVQVKKAAVEADELTAPVEDHPAGPSTVAGIKIDASNADVVAVARATFGSVKASDGENPLTDDDESEATGEETSEDTGHGHGEEKAHAQHHDYAQHLESACCIVMGLVVFTLIFESIRELLEWYLHKKEKHFELRVLERTLAEMAILGFISFVLFLIHDYKYISKMIAWMTNDNYVNVSHMLHDVHIMLFIVMLGYIACVFYITLLAKAAFRSWKKHGKHLASVDVSDGIDFKECLTIVDYILFLPFDLIFGNKLYESHFQSVREAFMHQPPARYAMYRDQKGTEGTKDSKELYVDYIQDSTQDAMLNMVELSWHVWLLFYFGAAFIYTITMFVQKDNGDQYIWLSVFLFCGWIPFVCALTCNIRLSWMLRKYKKDCKKDNPRPIESYYVFRGERRLIQDNLQCAIVGAVIYIAVYIKMFLALERIAGVGLLTVAIIPPILVFVIAPFIVPNYGLIVAASGGIAGKHDSVGEELKESNNADNNNAPNPHKRSVRHTSLARPMPKKNHAV